MYVHISTDYTHTTFDATSLGATYDVLNKWYLWKRGGGQLFLNNKYTPVLNVIISIYVFWYFEEEFLLQKKIYNFQKSIYQQIVKNLVIMKLWLYMDNIVISYY